MSNPRDAIDTRGNPSQRKALLDAVEIAHGARMIERAAALRDAIRTAQGVDLTDSQLHEAHDRQSFRFGWCCARDVIVGALSALAQSDLPEQGA